MASLAASSALSDSTNDKKRPGPDADDRSNKKRSATSASSSASTQIPYDEYFAKLKKFQTENGFIGQMLIKGIPSKRNEDGDYDSDDDDDEEEDVDKSTYTKEDMESLRFILINQSRADQLEEMEKLVLGDQAGSPFMMFNTSFSYQVLNSWYSVKQMMSSRSATMTLTKRIDILFAYTHIIHQHDVWMHDNEGGMDTLVKGLASTWKRLLSKNSDDDLGLDTYSKAGILELLSQFKKCVEEMDSCYGMGKFRYM